MSQTVFLTASPRVAALFVQSSGVYAAMPDVDPWPEERDARTYTGTLPVVAHPPCASWGRYSKPTTSSTARGPLRGNDAGCFAAALSAVRRCILWRELLAWAVERGGPTGQAPMWVLVPDVVADREGTIAAWHRYLPEVLALGFRPAFAAQDGMTPADVPPEANTVFLGGSDEWKMPNLHRWCAAFPGRVHVGRINGLPGLRACRAAGAASCDGTGFWSDDQWNQLVTFLEESAGDTSRGLQTSMSFASSGAAMAHGSRSAETAAAAPTGAERQ